MIQRRQDLDTKPRENNRLQRGRSRNFRDFLLILLLPTLQHCLKGPIIRLRDKLFTSTTVLAQNEFLLQISISSYVANRKLLFADLFWTPAHLRQRLITTEFSLKIVFSVRDANSHRCEKKKRFATRRSYRLGLGSRTRSSMFAIYTTNSNFTKGIRFGQTLH